ncbi:PilN domain-containing protein [Citrobacter sp. Ct235]|uniref:PilN domain-containing protein n=1 Tax=Citrobacter sp. Ct235 TaxID=2985157 RepID=UPI002578E136|nr:PilN domain-containing protein [Citrobacter sp. Ct235]EKZ2525630.1 PilN domain-containing protein [Citrobacter farmeri]MDM2735131.1 PilN domain-containing protein [Citrobacter sp. Ct235]
MQSPVNFLPWRQQRRSACLRLWGGLFSASAAIVLALMLSGYAVRSMSGRVNVVLLRAEQQLAAALATVKPRLEARQRQAQQVIQRDRLREQTRRWQSALENLALSIPAQAWLTNMDYQQSTLTLSGKALTFSALSALETALRDSPLFEINHTGATQRDAQGYWQFQYRLKWREAHDRPL